MFLSYNILKICHSQHLRAYFSISGIITNDYADDIILDPKEIARQYVRSWFLLDFISSIPLDYIFRVLNKHESYNQIFSAGKLFYFLVSVYI